RGESRTVGMAERGSTGRRQSTEQFLMLNVDRDQRVEEPIDEPIRHEFAPLSAKLIQTAERLVVAAAQVVIAVSTAVKDKCHQAPADHKRDHHAACDGYIAVGRYSIAAEMSPGVRRKPHRQCQKCEQRYEKDRDRNGIVSALRQTVGLNRADAGRCAGEEIGGFVRGHDWLLGFGFNSVAYPLK